MKNHSNRGAILASIIGGSCTIIAALIGLYVGSNNQTIQNIFNYNSGVSTPTNKDAVLSSSQVSSTISTEKKQNEPVWLDELAYMPESFQSNYEKSKVFSVGEIKKYPDEFLRGIEIDTWDYSPEDGENPNGENIEFSYNISRKYNTFTGTIVCTTVDLNDLFFPSTITIYCDSEEVYKSPGITTESKCIKIPEINLENVDILKFVVSTPHDNLDYSNYRCVYIAEGILK